MLAKFIQREKRLIKNEKVVFLILPLVLIPLLVELGVHSVYPEWFKHYHNEILLSNIFYIVIARFFVLDADILH